MDLAAAKGNKRKQEVRRVEVTDWLCMICGSVTCVVVVLAGLRGARGEEAAIGGRTGRGKLTSRRWYEDVAAIICLIRAAH